MLLGLSSPLCGAIDQLTTKGKDMFYLKRDVLFDILIQKNRIDSYILQSKFTIINKLSIDIILPCFNPANDWVQNIIVADNAMESFSIHWILVNDCSITAISDEVSMLKEGLAQFTYLEHHNNQGKGQAIRTGIAQTKNDVMLFTDIDIPFGIEGIEKVVRRVKEGNDVVFIQRNKSYFGHIPPARQKISSLAKWFNRKVFRLPFTDTQGGLKGFSAEGKAVLQATRLKGYLFDIELAKKAHHNPAIKLAQVEVNVSPDFENVSTNYWRLLKEVPSVFYLIFN